MARHDAPVAGANGAGRVDEKLLLDRQNRAPRDAREPGHLRDADRDHHVDQTDAQHDHHQDRQHHRRKAQHHVDGAAADRIDPPAAEAQQDADAAANHQREEDGRDAHGQRIPAAPDDARKDVASEKVGAEDVLGIGGAQTRTDIHLGGVERSNPGREDRRQHQHQQNHDAGRRAGMTGKLDRKGPGPAAA